MILKLDHFSGSSKFRGGLGQFVLLEFQSDIAAFVNKCLDSKISVINCILQTLGRLFGILAGGNDNN